MELDIEDEAQRKKVLHLVLCLLPKAHRDTMEVLFCFLNWVSSFHTVDEETGNKMDTWNIATVMAPNILRESNDREVKSVDQAAVKVVFDLIENNAEFSEVCFSGCLPVSFHLNHVQVPPEIMELLSDETSDMSAKEIMRQWEQRGKNPITAHHPSNSQNGTASRKDQRNAPQITTADNNPSVQAGETAVRPIAGAGGHARTQHSPAPGPDRGQPNAGYGPNPQASTDSHRTASPHRHSYRSPGFQKHTQVGTAGAG